MLKMSILRAFLRNTETVQHHSHIPPTITTTTSTTTIIQFMLFCCKINLRVFDFKNFELGKWWECKKIRTNMRYTCVFPLSMLRIWWKIKMEIMVGRHPALRPSSCNPVIYLFPHQPTTAKRASKPIW